MQRTWLKNTVGLILEERHKNSFLRPKPKLRKRT
jgi:hypothetical protein